MMRYLSLFSGIEAATVAWHPLGWRAAAFAEIEPFPRDVLAHHYPHVPNRGDVTRFQEWPDETVDLIVGGSPCQAFSIAGLRKGLADPRGNLTLTYLAVVARYCPRWVAWENVPGVLSDNAGRTFGAFIGGLAELGYGFAYRILDAQHFGIPQRRRRVFVVGYFGNWRRAAAVLFERHSLYRHPAPRRLAGQGTAAGAAGCTGIRGAISHALTSEGASEDGTGRGVPVVAFTLKQAAGNSSNRLFGLELGNQGSGGNVGFHSDERPFRTLDTNTPPGIVNHSAIRRLTPLECERLQGFPDHHTAIPYRGRPAAACPDAPRYKALGNSMAVPVMRWIGQRIATVDALPDVAVDAAVGSDMRYLGHAK